MKTFSLGKDVFISGLHWQVLSGKVSESKSEIRQLAKQLNFNLSVIRNTGVPQVGLGLTSEGCSAGMLSAAAIVSKTIELENNHQDFICATALPNGLYLYVCQSEGVIVPDGDVIGSAEIVRSRLLEDLSIGKSWEFIVAPIEWGVEGSKEIDFMDFLPRKNGKIDLKHPWWGLKPVNWSIGSSLKKVAIPLMLAGVIAAVVIGYNQWQAIKMAKDAALVAASIQSEKPPPPIPPWRNKPRAALVVSACVKVIKETKTFWPGNWQPVSATCDVASNSMTVSWKRGEYGWARHLLEVEPRAVISTDGTTASLTNSMVVGGENEEEALDDERIRLAQMNGAAQELRVRLEMSAPPAPAVLPGAQKTAAPPVPWQEMIWALKIGQLSPEAIIPVFDGPGFRIASIVAVFGGGQITWGIGGSQYVK
jgi:hypothetical protein